MGWKENAFGVDVGSAQTGLDFSVLKPFVDFGVVKMGETDRNTATVTYDEQFHIHVQNAYENNIPVGAYFVPDVEFNGTLQVPLDSYKATPRMKDLEYKFIQNTLLNKAVYFIALVFAHASTSSQWNQAGLEYLVNAIQAGQAAGEIKKMPIVICANEEFVKKNFAFGNTNMFFDFVPRTESPDLRIWSLSNTVTNVTSTWENIKNYFPLDTAKPTYLNATKYPPLFWQFAIDRLPMNKQGGTVSFGMNASTMTKTNLYSWMKFTPVVVPPVVVECPPGKHWDETLKDCVLDTVPPVVHTCPSGEHWDETLQKCVDDTPPVGTVCQEGYHWDSTQNKCVEDVIVEPPVVGGVLFDEKKLSACLKILGDALIAMSDVYK